MAMVVEVECIGINDFYDDRDGNSYVVGGQCAVAEIIQFTW